jgi:hypothetical protein
MALRIAGDSVTPVRKRPRKLKSPQGLSTVPLLVRIPVPASVWLDSESRRRGLSKARIVGQILLTQMLEQARKNASQRPPLPPGGKSDITD